MRYAGLLAGIALLLAVTGTAGAITIDGIISPGEWDPYYLGTVTTDWKGGTSTDVYGYADDTYLYAAYVADTSTDGWNAASGLGVGANLDYWTPVTAVWPDQGYTHISPYGDGFAQTDGSGWTWPDGWGNGDWAVRGIEMYVGHPMWNTNPNPNVAELKIPLSLLEYAGTDGVIGLSGQYWQYNFAPPLLVTTSPPVPEPVTLAGLVLGVGSLVGYVRRRRR